MGRPKKSTSTEPEADSAPGPFLAAMVDELGTLENELAVLRPKIARAELLRKSIRAVFEDKPAIEPFEAKGTRFSILVGPRATQQTINIARLVREIGVRSFSLFATCTLGALKDHVSDDVAAKVCTSGPTGPRSLKIFELGVKVEAA